MRESYTKLAVSFHGVNPSVFLTPVRSSSFVSLNVRPCEAAFCAFDATLPSNSTGADRDSVADCEASAAKDDVESRYLKAIAANVTERKTFKKKVALTVCNAKGRDEHTGVERMEQLYLNASLLTQSASFNPSRTSFLNNSFTQ